MLFICVPTLMVSFLPFEQHNSNISQVLHYNSLFDWYYHKNWSLHEVHFIGVEFFRLWKLFQMNGIVCQVQIKSNSFRLFVRVLSKSECYESDHEFSLYASSKETTTFLGNECVSQLIDVDENHCITFPAFRFSVCFGVTNGKQPIWFSWIVDKTAALNQHIAEMRRMTWSTHTHAAREPCLCMWSFSSSNFQLIQFLRACHNQFFDIYVEWRKMTTNTHDDIVCPKVFSRQLMKLSTAQEMSTSKSEILCYYPSVTLKQCIHLLPTPFVH